MQAISTVEKVADQALIQEMKAVDWDVIDQREAASFALSLMLFNDSTQEAQKVQSLSGSKLNSVISLIVVSIVGMLAKTPAPVLAGALVATQLMSLVWAKLDERRTKSATRRAHGALIDDVKLLAQRHPKQRLAA